MCFRDVGEVVGRSSVVLCYGQLCCLERENYFSSVNHDHHGGDGMIDIDFDHKLECHLDNSPALHGMRKLGWDRPMTQLTLSYVTIPIRVIPFRSRSTSRIIFAVFWSIFSLWWS